MENQSDHACLTDEEIAEPILVLKKILSDGISSDLLKIDLWEWVKATLSHQQWSYHQSPDMVLYLHDYFVRLLTALHLLLLNREEIPETDQKDQERQRLKDYYRLFYQYRGIIRRLNMPETADPFIAVRACFEYHGLEEWKSVLSEWREFALSSTSIAETGPEIEILKEYEQLEKMIEASYFLIGEESKFPERFHQIYWNNLQTAISPFLKDNRQVSLELLKTFLQFVDTVPAVRIGKNLRNIFMDYLQYNKGCMPIDFEDYLLDLENLFHFLDVAVEETIHWDRKEENDGK